jgi:hypothetical protein
MKFKKNAWDKIGKSLKIYKKDAKKKNCKLTRIV